MKNFLIYIIVSTMLSITSGLVYAKFYLSPRVKELVQTKATELLGVPVQIHDLRVLILPKLSLAATGVKFVMTDPNLKVDIPKLYIEAPLNRSLFSRTIPFGPVLIRFEDPKINYEVIAKSESQAKPEYITHTQFKFGRDFNVELKINHAKFKMTEVNSRGDIENETSLDPLDLNIDIPGVEKDWIVSLRTQLKMSHPELSLPVDIQGEFSLKDQILSVANAKGSLSGVPFSLSGEQNFPEDMGNWKFHTDVANFAALKKPPNISSLKNLKGSLNADLSAIRVSGKPWQIFGSVNAKSFSADTNLKQDNLVADGTFKLNLESKFSYSGYIKVEQLNVHANFDAIELQRVGIFNKPKSIPLSFDASFVGREQVLNILDFTVIFLNLKTFATGSFGLTQDHPSEVNVHFENPSLIGWEKFFPILGGAPLSGMVTMDSTLREDAEKNWSIDFHPLKLEKLNGNILYKDEVLQMAGPFEINSEVRGIYNFSKPNGQLKLNGTGVFNLSNFQFLASKQALNPLADPSDHGSSFYLPNSKDSRFRLTAQVGHFHTDHITADGLSTDLSFNDQVITGTAKIAKFDAGEINATNLNYNLRRENLTGKVEFKKIDANQLLTSINPNSSGLIKGEASGQISIDATSADFLNHLKANGRINLKNAVIANHSIDDLIDEKLSHIPGVGKPKPPVVNISGAEISVLFGLAESNLNILDFKLLTPARNELQARGSLILNSQNLNLSGTAFLADAPIGGDIRAANSDTQGRFMVPFSLLGTLKKPEVSFAQKTIEEVLRKTLIYTANKLKRGLTGEKEPPAATVSAPVSSTEDPDDVEEQETVATAPPSPITPAPTPTKEPTPPPKPPEDKVQALKNRLQGIFDPK